MFNKYKYKNSLFITHCVAIIPSFTNHCYKREFLTIITIVSHIIVNCNATNELRMAFVQ